MVQEFRNYGIIIVGISETKWLCMRWKGIRSYILGSQYQGLGEAVERNEGVGIVFNTDMVCLWGSSGRV